MADGAGQRDERHDHRAGADGDFQIIAKHQRKNRQHQDTAAAAGKAAHPADAAAEHHGEDGLAGGWAGRGSSVVSTGDRFEQKLEAEKDRREHGDVAKAVRRLLAEEIAAVAADDRTQKSRDRDKTAALEVDVFVFIVCVCREQTCQYVGRQRHGHGVIAGPAAEADEHGRDDHGGGQTGQTGHNAGAQSGQNIKDALRDVHGIT